MSFASGCMDILSYRRLGQVFTSAMTGNAALLGLGLGQGNIAAASRNMAAFVGFLIGLGIGAALLRGHRSGPGWSRAMTRALFVEEVLLVAFAALWHFGSSSAIAGQPPRGFRWPVSAFLAYVSGAAFTGFLLPHPGPMLAAVPAVELAALPAIVIAVVLFMALVAETFGALKAKRMKRR